MLVSRARGAWQARRRTWTRIPEGQHLGPRLLRSRSTNKPQARAACCPRDQLKRQSSISRKFARVPPAAIDVCFLSNHPHLKIDISPFYKKKLSQDICWACSSPRQVGPHRECVATLLLFVVKAFSARSLVQKIIAEALSLEKETLVAEQSRFFSALANLTCAWL